MQHELTSCIHKRSISKHVKRSHSLCCTTPRRLVRLFFHSRQLRGLIKHSAQHRRRSPREPCLAVIQQGSKAHPSQDAGLSTEKNQRRNEITKKIKLLLLCWENKPEKGKNVSKKIKTLWPVKNTGSYTCKKRKQERYQHHKNKTEVVIYSCVRTYSGVKKIK